MDLTFLFVLAWFSTKVRNIYYYFKIKKNKNVLIRLRKIATLVAFPSDECEGVVVAIVYKLLFFK